MINQLLLAKTLLTLTIYLTSLRSQLQLKPLLLINSLPPQISNNNNKISLCKSASGNLKPNQTSSKIILTLITRSLSSTKKLLTSSNNKLIRRTQAGTLVMNPSPKTLIKLVIKLFNMSGRLMHLMIKSPVNFKRMTMRQPQKRILISNLNTISRHMNSKIKQKNMTNQRQTMVAAFGQK